MYELSLPHSGKWLACQSMDNQILIFGAQNRFRLNKKKIFKGHMVAGYACQVDFSPDMRCVSACPSSSHVHPPCVLLLNPSYRGQNLILVTMATPTPSCEVRLG